MIINTAKKEYAISAYSFLAHDELLYFMQQLAAPPLTEEYNARRSHFLLPLAMMVGATMYVIKYKKQGKG